MQSNAMSVDYDSEETTLKAGLKQVHPKVLKAAYSYCRAITQSHYENFPVASVIIPKKMRPAIEAIYAFSRTADDFADEKEYRHVRMEKLNEWQGFLDDQETSTNQPVFIALHDTIERHQLPKHLFLDLLTAFKMDVKKNRYANFDEVLHYCRHSANPVGRLVLHLFKQDQKEKLLQSDCICTALQLANFWQDVAVDLKKDRIYLPQDDRDKFNVMEKDLFAYKAGENFKRLLDFQVERTRQLFIKGRPLGLSLKGKLGLEIRLTWLTGFTILKKIIDIHFDVLNQRPVLTKKDFIKLFFVALSKKRYLNYDF